MLLNKETETETEKVDKSDNVTWRDKSKDIGKRKET